MLDAIAGYLVAEGLGTLATDLFIGQMPDQPDTCIALYGYAGRPPSFEQDSPQPALRYPRLQVVVRDPSDPVAHAKALILYDALCDVVNTQLADLSFGRITPLQEPFLLRIDASERAVVACNYEVTIL